VRTYPMTNLSIPQVFVLMPFASKFNQLFEYIKVAAEAADAKAERVDEQLHEEDILNRIIGQIERADAIVAVMTGKSPNVFFEVGIAHALRKHVVLLTSDPNDIPFDVAHLKHVPYKTSFLRPNILLEADRFTTSLTAELKFILANPRVADSYYQEYKKAVIDMESLSCGLAPYFTPITTRYFGQWKDFITTLVNEGTETEGPERLAITRLLIHATQRYRVIERMVGDPAAVNSKDWISFYDEIGRNSDVEKTWILCADEAEITRMMKDVVASWRFRKEKNFDTRYCSPRELHRATGEQLPPYDAIEDFGEFVKLLSLAGDPIRWGKRQIAS